jgi:hypothetical protein
MVDLYQITMLYSMKIKYIPSLTHPAPRRLE